MPPSRFGDITFSCMKQPAPTAASEFGRTLPAEVVGMEASVMHKRRVGTTSAGAQAIAQRVTALRKARGITQVELAARLEVSQALVSKLERGEVLIHAELLAQLAGIFKVSSDELLGLHRSRARPAHVPITPAVDKGLARKFALLQSLSRRDRETISRTIDALVAARANSGSRAA